MDLTALYLLVLPAALYVRAVRVLARRGYRVPRAAAGVAGTPGSR